MIRATAVERRSFVLIAVLLVIGSALLVATSLLFVAQTESAAAAGSREAVQARALAWSGVQIIMSKLNDQRDRMLRSERPALDNQFVVYESGNRQGVVRLLPAYGRTGDSILFAEAGGLDLNTVTADELAATGCLTADEAQAIVSYRDGAANKRLHSILDLLRVPGAGITVEKLFGPAEATASIRNQPGASDHPGYRGLIDLLTVHAIEPQVQSSGEPRINLNVAWSDELGRQVEAQFDRDAADLLRKLFDSGTKFDSDAAMVATLRKLDVSPRDWGRLLDTFATDDQPTHEGRLDINNATAQALRALPGVTQEQADAMARARSELSADERANIAWPVAEQIISPDAFESIAERITNRSWTFRIRLVAGEELIDEPGKWIGHPAKYEAVIDLSLGRPRVAYLRDIAVLDETLAIVGDVRARGVQGAG